MATPEKALVFNISAPPKEAPVIDVSKPDEKQTLVPPNQPDKSSQPPKTTFSEKLRKNAVPVAIAGILILGGLGYAISRIASANNTQPPPAEETIAKENIIQLTKSSFTPVSDEEMQKLWQNNKTVDLENYTFTIGFPIDQATIDEISDLTMNSYFEPKLFLGVDTSRLEQKGIKNLTQLSGFPKDTSIAFNYDSTKFDASIIAIGIAGVRQGEGSNSFTPAYTNLRVILRDKQSGKNYESTIDILYGKPLIALASYPKNHHPVYEDGTPINPDQSIAQLATDLQDWDGKNHVLPGQKGQVVYSAIAGGIDPITSELLIFTPVFLKTTDGNVASHE